MKSMKIKCAKQSHSFFVKKKRLCLMRDETNCGSKAFSVLIELTICRLFIPNQEIRVSSQFSPLFHSFILFRDAIFFSSGSLSFGLRPFYSASAPLFTYTYSRAFFIDHTAMQIRFSCSHRSQLSSYLFTISFG